MTVKTTITDPSSSHAAIVTARGELVTGAFSYSSPYYKKIAVANTAYEIVKGLSGKQFVITSIILASDKNFASATAGEAVNIYGAHPSDIGTSIDAIFSLELLKNDRLFGTGVNLITAEACSIVGIAPTDAAIDVTIAGYYVPA